MGMTSHARPNLKSPPLKRGTACLACRKRKSRCDGAHPVCKQCVKSHREDQCVYGDAKRKSRTQQLREKVTTLRDRVQELEYESGNGTPQLSFPALYSSPEDADDSFSATSFTDLMLSSASSSSGSPSSSTLEVLSTESSPTLEQDVLDMLACSDEFTPLSGPPSIFTQMCQWNARDPFCDENKKLLVDIYIAHRHQCWFDCVHDRPLSETVCHPALMNAVYLLGSYHVKHSSYFSKLESVFLNRTSHAISSALGNCDHLVDVVRASALLAVYFYSNGRHIDGYRHLFSASRLAVGLGLHQIYAPDLHGFSMKLSLDRGTSPVDNAPIHLHPPTNPLETQDRVSAFWQVFMVEHCWSGASGAPSLLPDMNNQVRITTPWPVLDVDSNFSLSSTSSEFSLFKNALKVKAALLYERSLSVSLGPQYPDDPNYWNEVELVGNAVQALHNCLPSIQRAAGDASAVDLDVFFVHTLLFVCNIHVHRNTDPAAAFHATVQVVSMIRHLHETDYEYLDPLLAAWWGYVANYYIAHTRSSERVGQPYMQAQDDLRLVRQALKMLEKHVPLAVNYGQQIEEELSIFQDAYLPSPFFEGTESLEFASF